MYISPQQLTVIYDPNCELCRRCKRWIGAQRQLVPVTFVEATDPAVSHWAQGLVPVGDELVVVSETGATWYGPDAFLACLWALEKHRRLAGRLQSQGLSHLAKGAFHALSGGRSGISRLLTNTTDGTQCDDGSCRA